MNQFNWDTSFLVDFDLETARSKTAETSKRTLSEMKDMFHDTKAAEEILKTEDPVIYEWYFWLPRAGRRSGFWNNNSLSGMCRR